MMRRRGLREEEEEYIDTNFNGTFNIVYHCAKYNIPLIYAGSSSHHSGRFKNPYTFSKDLGEDIDIGTGEDYFNYESKWGPPNDIFFEYLSDMLQY